jgi:ABC-type sugar transport system permease subunit
MSKLTDSPHHAQLASKTLSAGWVSIIVCMLFSFILAVLSLQQATRHYQGQLQSWLAQHTVQMLSQQPKGALAQQLQAQRKKGQHPTPLYPQLETLGLKVYVNAIHTTPKVHATSTLTTLILTTLTLDEKLKDSQSSFNDTLQNNHPAIFQSTTYLFDETPLKHFKDKRWFDAFWSHKTLWKDLKHNCWASAHISSTSSKPSLIAKEDTNTTHNEIIKDSQGKWLKGKWLSHVPLPKAPILPWNQLVLTWITLTFALLYFTSRYVGWRWIGLLQLLITIGPISWVLLHYCSEQEALVSQLLNSSDHAPLFTLARYIPLSALLPIIVLCILNLFTRAKRSQHRVAYTYMAPTLISVSLLVFVPFSIGLVLAFMRHDHGTFTWVGIDHFIQILYHQDYNITHPLNFYFTLAVTLLWTFVNVFFHTSLGLALALILNTKGLYLKGIYRALLIIPWAIPNYITALIWKGMFNQNYGLINYCLQFVGIEPIAWMHGFWGAMSANVVTNTWLGFPFMMVVSLGALQSIPKDLYEAAHIAGASRWIQFKEITLPLLRPALLPAVILGSVWTFNMFNIIYLVSGGQPNGASDILITEAYRWAFEQDRYGYASAYSLIIFVILLGYASLTQKLSRSAEEIYQ